MHNVNRPCLIRNRQNNRLLVGSDASNNILSKLYSSIPGRFFVRHVISRKWFSNISGMYLRSPISCHLIQSLTHNEEDILNAKSFSEYFDREWEQDFVIEDGVFPAIAQSKLSVYPIDENFKVGVKGIAYSLDELVAHRIPTTNYSYCLVFRLSLNDCHRVFFCDNGQTVFEYDVPGVLHTIRPIANNEAPLKKNTRHIALLDTEEFGSMVYIEVGATLTGRIVCRQKNHFSKLEEKSRFELGGSTVILLVSDIVDIDCDILRDAVTNIECQVNPGERIGIKRDRGDQKTS